MGRGGRGAESGGDWPVERLSGLLRHASGHDDELTDASDTGFGSSRRAAGHAIEPDGMGADTAGVSIAARCSAASALPGSPLAFCRRGSFRSAGEIKTAAAKAQMAIIPVVRSG